jgi:glucose dehydrogenase
VGYAENDSTVQKSDSGKGEATWDYGDALVNRGVAMWLDPARNAKPALQCRRRIYEATLDARLIALDSASGIPLGLLPACP